MTKQEQLENKRLILAQLEAKQAELRAEIAKLEKGWRWVPGFNERYSYITASGATFNDKWRGSLGDHFCLSVGNVFHPGDKEGLENYKLFQQSIVPSCAFEDVVLIVVMGGAIEYRRGFSMHNAQGYYLLGRGFDSLEKAEAWRELYHEVQLRKCGG